MKKSKGHTVGFFSRSPDVAWAIRLYWKEVEKALDEGFKVRTPIGTFYTRVEEPRMYNGFRGKSGMTKKIKRICFKMRESKRKIVE